MRIQSLQKIGGIVAALSCILLGGAAMAISYGDYSRFADAARKLDGFHLSLVSANAVSAERGPANAAMGGTEAEMPKLVEALRQKRQKTDAALRVLANADFVSIAGMDAHRLLNDLASALATGRAEVDKVVAAPPQKRSGVEVETAIWSMFSVADSAGRIRDAAGKSIIRSTPQIGTDVVLSSAASELREHEGRLGSYVVMMLTSGPDADTRLRRDIDRTIERLHLIRQNLGAYADAYFGDPELGKLLSAIHTDYFRGGLDYALRTAAVHGPGNTLSAAEFTANYVPAMQSSEEFREKIIAASVRRLEVLYAGAWRNLVLAGVLTAITLCFIFAVAVLMRKRLFVPLIGAREQIMAIVRGDLADPKPVNTVSPEIGEMFDGIDELRKRLREKFHLERAQRLLNQRLMEMSQTDALTGLPNRRALLEAATRLAALESEKSLGSAVAVFDIDHFKKINDTFGHAVGDVVLRKLGKVVTPLLRQDDVLARYGGEEFVVILNDVDESTALSIIERIRLALSKTCFNETYNLYVTASFGIAMRVPGIRADWDSLIKIADRRLYLAKERGRNRTVLRDDEPVALRNAG